MSWADRGSSHPARRSPWPHRLRHPGFAGTARIADDARGPVGGGLRPREGSHDYVDWSKTACASHRQGAGKPDWKAASPGFRRTGSGQRVHGALYAGQGRRKVQRLRQLCGFPRNVGQRQRCNAVKIMTPDHLHATVAIAAMKQGQACMMHKPLANRLHEARLVIDTARKTGGRHAFFCRPATGPIPSRSSLDNHGAIGKLRGNSQLVQSPGVAPIPTLPDRTPSLCRRISIGTLVGTLADRPYHPHYTNAVFRGWYEFGGGAWPTWATTAFGRSSIISARFAHCCRITSHSSLQDGGPCPQ